MRDFFSVAIEGGDGVGKDTQSRLLRAELESRGLRVKHVEVPVKSAFTHRAIYFMLRRGLAKRYPRLFHVLQFVNKFWWQVFTLPFVVRSYDALVLDRWNVSYWVYGLETGLGESSWLMKLYHVLYRPDCVLVLAASRHASEQRDEYERDRSLQERVKSRYKQWAFSRPDAGKVVNADQPIADVHRDVIDVLCRRGLLPGKKEGMR